MKPQEILKEAREKSGETQEVIAGKIGVSLRMYQRYEEGKFPKYRSDSIEKLDKLFGTQIYGMLYDKTVRKVPQPEPDPATVILPTGDVKRTLADYIAIIELYNKTLSSAINAGLIDIKNNLKEAEANLARGQQEIKEQILVTAMGAVQQLSGVVPTAPVPLTTKGKGNGGKKKATVDNGKNKVHSP